MVRYTCSYTWKRHPRTAEIAPLRTNIVLDDELIEEAFALTGARTKKELVHMALRELVRSRKKKDLTELAGRIRLRDDYDHKALRELRGGSG